MACRGTVRNVLRTHPESQADNNTEREALGFLPSFSVRVPVIRHLIRNEGKAADHLNEALKGLLCIL